MSTWVAQVHTQFLEGWYPLSDDFEYAVQAESKSQARLAVEDCIELYYIGDDETITTYSIMEEEEKK